MSAEMFGTVVKRTKNGYEDVTLYTKNDNGEFEPVDISLGNASAFREHFDFFIENAADVEEYVPEDDEFDFNGVNKWDHTYYISLDRMELLKYRYAEKINMKKFEKIDDIYEMEEDELIYYMLDKFVSRIKSYLSLADWAYGCFYHEYFFKFKISY